MFKFSFVGGIAALALACAALSAQASAPPVGPLPKATVTGIQVPHGQIFGIALPRPAAGLFWRGARLSDATIARPLYEGEVNGNIVVVYRAGHAGKTTLVYALTKDEGPKALQARKFVVTVS